MTGSWEHTYGPSATLRFLLPSTGFKLRIWIEEWISQLMVLLLLSFVFGVIAGSAEAGQSVFEEGLAWHQTRWPEKWLQVNYYTHDHRSPKHAAMLNGIKLIAQNFLTKDIYVDQQIIFSFQFYTGIITSMYLISRMFIAFRQFSHHAVSSPKSLTHF